MIPGMPDWAWRWIGVAAALAALWFGYEWWEHSIYQQGYDRANAEWVKKEEGISAAAEAKYQKQWRDAVKRGDELQTKVNEMTATRAAMENDHAKNLNGAVASAVAGAQRLWIRTQSAACPLPASAAQTPAADSSGSGPVQGAEILPELAGQLVGIAGASAKDVRDFNSLLNFTRMIRSECLRTEGDGNGTQDEARTGP